MNENKQVPHEAPHWKGKDNGGQPPLWIVLAVILYFVLGAAILVALILNVPGSVGPGNVVEFIDQHTRYVFLYILGMMISCGMLGGSLYDIRGLIKHSANNDYQPAFNLSYLLRPVAGALCGLIALFLLMAGQLGMSPGEKGLSGTGWITFEGRLLYLTFGFLAGYASQVFMAKLKDIADAAFSTNNSEPKEKKSSPSPVLRDPEMKS